METALLHSGDQTWAPSGAAFAGRELLVAALGARWALLFDEAAGDLKLVFTSATRLRDVLPVGGISMWITTQQVAESGWSVG